MGGREVGGSLSPSSLHDITDGIALTNGHLSASVTQQQIKRSETRLGLFRICIMYNFLPVCMYGAYLRMCAVVLDTHVHEFIDEVFHVHKHTLVATWASREKAETR